MGSATPADTLTGVAPGVTTAGRTDANTGVTSATGCATTSIITVGPGTIGRGRPPSSHSPS
jgi:hypothetical protein